jgi:hypothetical protein
MPRTFMANQAKRFPESTLAELPAGLPMDHALFPLMAV